VSALLCISSSICNQKSYIQFPGHPLTISGDTGVAGDCPVEILENGKSKTVFLTLSLDSMRVVFGGGEEMEGSPSLELRNANGVSDALLSSILVDLEESDAVKGL